MSKHTAGPWFVTGQMTKYVAAKIGGGIIQEVAAAHDLLDIIDTGHMNHIATAKARKIGREI